MQRTWAAVIRKKIETGEFMTNKEILIQNVNHCFDATVSEELSRYRSHRHTDGRANKNHRKSFF